MSSKRPRALRRPGEVSARVALKLPIYVPSLWGISCVILMLNGGRRAKVLGMRSLEGATWPSRNRHKHMFAIDECPDICVEAAGFLDDRYLLATTLGQAQVMLNELSIELAKVGLFLTP